MTTRRQILDFDRAGLVNELQSELGLPPFRARQLIQWLHRRRVHDFAVMTDINAGLRAELASRYDIFRPTVVQVQQSVDGTRKYLMGLADGSNVETVLIKQPSRYTLCVSSQVGCAIGCRFCKTAQMGLKRNLHTHEIVGQVLAVQDDIAQLGIGEGEDGFRNIVFMGMGEPLHNIDNVIRSVKILNDDLGHSFSGRKITVSTSGLVPAIQKFGASDAQANLAVSLNATTDRVRDEVMPINKRWNIEQLISALIDYPLHARKRITIEYVMLAGVNDSDADLRRLPEVIRGLRCKVNLIPYNSNTDLGYYSPKREVIERWQRELLGQGINATVRWSKGEDISAACGQLATASRRERRASRSEDTDGPGVAILP